MTGSVTRNAERSRYELALDGDVAFALYREEPGAVIVTHTETPRHLRGRGIGARLVRGVWEDIAARSLKVVPRWRSSPASSRRIRSPRSGAGRALAEAPVTQPRQLPVRLPSPRTTTDALLPPILAVMVVERVRCVGLLIEMVETTSVVAPAAGAAQIR